MKTLSFSPIVEEICNGNPSKGMLLSCEPFKLTYSEFHVNLIYLLLSTSSVVFCNCLSSI